MLTQNATTYCSRRRARPDTAARWTGCVDYLRRSGATARQDSSLSGLKQCWETIVWASLHLLDCTTRAVWVGQVRSYKKTTLGAIGGSCCFIASMCTLPDDLELERVGHWDAVETADGWSHHDAALTGQPLDQVHLQNVNTAARAGPVSSMQQKRFLNRRTITCVCWKMSICRFRLWSKLKFAIINFDFLANLNKI